MTATGSEATRLVVLRGNSGSGKSTTARELRACLGRGVAWVEQDYLRRVVLRDHDVPDGASIGLIDQTARYALDHGYDVIVEGILHTTYYEPMLQRLTDDHAGTTRHYFFDIPFDETVRRHATRPLAQAFSPDDMRAWYRTTRPARLRRRAGHRPHQLARRHDHADQVRPGLDLRRPLWGRIGQRSEFPPASRRDQRALPIHAQAAFGRQGWWRIRTAGMTGTVRG